MEWKERKTDKWREKIDLLHVECTKEEILALDGRQAEKKNVMKFSKRCTKGVWNRIKVNKILIETDAEKFDKYEKLTITFSFFFNTISNANFILAVHWKFPQFVLNSRGIQYSSNENFNVNANSTPS